MCCAFDTAIAHLDPSVVFWLALLNYPTRANLNTCPIPVYPWVVQYMVLCTLKLRWYTKRGALFLYAPFVYWNMGVYRNVTPVPTTSVYPIIPIPGINFFVFFFFVLIHCAQCDDNNPEHADQTSTQHFILICIDFLCC